MAPDIQDGWLCPLYKKRESAIMNRIAEATPSLIHKSQTAFIKGCSIFDQIDLARRMIDLCHLKNRNGVIILLDQEKASP